MVESTKWLGLVAGVVVVLAVARFLFRDSVESDTMIDRRGNVASTVFVYDPDAILVVDVGPDGAPGQAGVDDAANGITDDRAELGATKSDDVCHVVFGNDASFVDQDPDGRPRLTLAKGAFRPALPNEQLDEHAATRTRFYTKDQNGHPIEWMTFED